MNASRKGMDTILKPRYLCSTATDESSSEEDDDTDVVHFDKKDSTCSSKITVIPNCASIVQVEMLEEKEHEDDDYDENEEEGSSGSKIICPTARFLQVNPKKVSSFDLLVRPPKRPRFINHPSREHIAHASAFKQKTKPIKLPPKNPTVQVGLRKKSPIVESIYFENEKLRYRQTMSGNWSSSSSSASPRNQINAKSHGPPKPMKTQQQPDQLTSLYVNPESLPQKFSEEETLRDIELSDAYHQKFYAGDGGGSGTGAAHMDEETKFLEDESTPEESQDASSIFRTCYEDQSSTYNGHVILDEKTGEFRVIHHPDLRELQSESATVIDGDSFLDNMADKNENICKLQEEDKEDDQEDVEYDDEERPISALLPNDSFDHLNGNRSSPLTIFLTTGSMMGGSGIDLGQGQDLHDMRFEMGSPFTHFGTEGEGDSDEEEGGDGELEGSRIEDVTDLVGDDEQVDSVIHLVRSGEDGEGSAEMKTIFWANSAPDASNKAGNMDRVTSEPCQLMDGFKDKRKDKVKQTTTSELNSISQQSWDLQEEIDAQEFLLQPKPKLNLSSSVHSAFERGNVERTSTVAMFVEKKTKSDYFVGKIKGTSKTLLKPGFIHENSNIKIKNKLEFNEDSNIDNTGNDDTTDSQGHRPEEESHHQPKLQKSSSALAIAVVNAKRKVSSGNRIRNAIPDKTPKKKGMSPPPLRNHTATFVPTSARRGEVQQLRFPRSSSSSSHQQILMTIKAKSPSYTRQKTAKNYENQKHHKSILKKDKKPNFFMRIFGRLFGISTTEKPKHSNNNNRRIFDDLVPSVPSSVLKRSDRGIVHHTDSKELYRERRRKFYNEQKEFRDESLATYLEGMLSHDNSSGAQDFVTIPPGIPLTYFLERSVAFPREAVEDAFNNNKNSSRTSDKNNNEFSPSTVPVPVRLAKSESALTGNGGSGQGGRQTSIARANLVLQFPPFVQVLAAGMTRRRRSSLENKSDFKRVKEELKKPLRGILKNQ